MRADYQTIKDLEDLTRVHVLLNLLNELRKRDQMRLINSIIRMLSLVYMHNLHPCANLLPGAKLHPGVNLHPLM